MNARKVTCPEPGEPSAYEIERHEHEQRDCVCTMDTLEGRKARAGQFWDEVTQRDTRDEVAHDR